MPRRLCCKVNQTRNKVLEMQVKECGHGQYESFGLFDHWWAEIAIQRFLCLGVTQDFHVKNIAYRPHLTIVYRAREKWYLIFPDTNSPWGLGRIILDELRSMISGRMSEDSIGESIFFAFICRGGNLFIINIKHLKETILITSFSDRIACTFWSCTGWCCIQVKATESPHSLIDCVHSFF